MKKIFFRGKVYDHNKDNPLIDIQKEIQAELMEQASYVWIYPSRTRMNTNSFCTVRL